MKVNNLVPVVDARLRGHDIIEVLYEDGIHELIG